MSSGDIARRVAESEMLTITVTTGSGQSPAYPIELGDRPTKPKMVLDNLISYGSTSQESGRLPYTEPVAIERGAIRKIDVTPLVDPKDKDAALLFEFKQTGISHKIQAEIVQVQSGPGIYLYPHYIAIIEVPDSLKPGLAELEVQIHANNKYSDSTVLVVTIDRPLQNCR